MVTIDFDYNTDVDYPFQHKYRSKAINFYYMKEMIFGLCICFITLAIYFDYVDRFRGKDDYMTSTLVEIDPSS
jgi:hypothetical protein